MLNGSDKVEVKVGDFVEGFFVADPETIRRGVVIEVMGPRTAVIKGRGFESICEGLHIISVAELTAHDRELRRYVAEKFLAKGGDDASIHTR